MNFLKKSVAILLATIYISLAFSIGSDNAIKRESISDNKDIVYSYNDSISNAIKAVVNITTEKSVKSGSSPFDDPFFRQFFGDMVPQDKIQGGIGSGVIIQSDGYIVTNSHVVADADKITVIIPGDNKKYSARLIGNDPQSDIAVIKIDKNNLPTLKFADSSKYLVGDVVFAIGNPFGVGETVTNGIISALNKRGLGISSYENFIQTDASINPGNSGGALIDTRGNLIGINTAIISRTGGNHGVGFAIPSNMVKSIAEQLVKDGKVIRGFLGISMQDIDEEVSNMYKTNNGVLVIGTERNSPAQKSDIQVWDLIIEVNGEPVKNAYDMKNRIGNMKPNDRVVLTIVRQEQDGSRLKNVTKKIPVVLSSQGRDKVSSNTQSIDGSPKDSDLNGLNISNITNRNRMLYSIPDEIQGVIVTDVRSGSKSESLGFEKFDIISRIESIPIKNTNDYKRAMMTFKDKQKRMLVYNIRTGRAKTIIVK